MSGNNLKKAGLKNTVPRLKILSILEGSNGKHLTAENIYQMMLSQGDEIGLATVYRVLTQFEAAEIVIRHNFDSGHSVFELDQGEHHDHLLCNKCGKIEEFVDELIEQRQELIAKQKNFDMIDHALYIYGICGKCNAKSKINE